MASRVSSDDAAPAPPLCPPPAATGSYEQLMFHPRERFIKTRRSSNKARGGRDCCRPDPGVTRHSCDASHCVTHRSPSPTVWPASPSLRRSLSALCQVCSQLMSCLGQLTDWRLAGRSHVRVEPRLSPDRALKESSRHLASQTLDTRTERAENRESETRESATRESGRESQYRCLARAEPLAPTAVLVPASFYPAGSGSNARSPPPSPSLSFFFHSCALHNEAKRSGKDSGDAFP